MQKAAKALRMSFACRPEFSAASRWTNTKHGISPLREKRHKEVDTMITLAIIRVTTSTISILTTITTVSIALIITASTFLVELLLPSLSYYLRASGLQ